MLRLLFRQEARQGGDIGVDLLLSHGDIVSGSGHVEKLKTEISSMRKEIGDCNSERNNGLDQRTVL